MKPTSRRPQAAPQALPRLGPVWRLQKTQDRVLGSQPSPLFMGLQTQHCTEQVTPKAWVSLVWVSLPGTALHSVRGPPDTEVSQAGSARTPL